MSFFSSTTLLPEDPILNLPILFNKDERPHKVNLGIGIYHDAEGKPIVLKSVKIAEADLICNERSKEYLPIQGMPDFIESIKKLVFGDSIAGRESFVAQTLGGTGALRVGGEFLSHGTSKNIYLPNPSWPNHNIIFTRAGMNIHSYTYYDFTSHSINFKGMCEDIQKIPAGSAIVLHPCCHNPTGVDLTFDQWKELSDLIKKQNILPFFDFAYQGFKEGVHEDAQPVRYFAAQGHEMLVANSLSKSFGMYNERVGALSIILNQKDLYNKVRSHIKQIIRGNYSNPPAHGAKVAAHILSSEDLKEAWLGELSSMRHRIMAMRQDFFHKLQKHIPEKDWSFIQHQYGFFSYTGLSQEQTKLLMAQYGIYMPADGRINIAGLYAHNLEYVVSSIANVIHL
jgi:aspartate/tyrosine/aromatic aminotransferase